MARTITCRDCEPEPVARRRPPGRSGEDAHGETAAGAVVNVVAAILIALGLLYGLCFLVLSFFVFFWGLGVLVRAPLMALPAVLLTLGVGGLALLLLASGGGLIARARWALHAAFGVGLVATVGIVGLLLAGEPGGLLLVVPAAGCLILRFEPFVGAFPRRTGGVPRPDGRADARPPRAF